MKEYVFIVTGAFSSGKTTFIQSASDRAPSGITFLDPVDVPGDRGFIAVRGAIFHLFAPPATRRFDFMWAMLEHNRVAGYILMVNSTQPAQFREAKSLIETFNAYLPAPYVVAANRQDSPDAWDTEALKIALHFAPEIPVIPCIATDPASVKNVLLALCYRILDDIVQSKAEK